MTRMIHIICNHLVRNDLTSVVPGRRLRQRGRQLAPGVASEDRFSHRRSFKTNVVSLSLQSCRARPYIASAKLAQVLQVQRRHPLLLLDQVHLNTEGVPVFFSRLPQS